MLKDSHRMHLRARMRKLVNLAKAAKRVKGAGLGGFPIGQDWSRAGQQALREIPLIRRAHSLSIRNGVSK